ncbi:MAG: hypothetical protein ACQEV7_16060 [Bacillota bacterium]
MKLSSFLKVSLLAVFSFSLIGCNSDINLSADITINGEDVNYTGYTGASVEETEANSPPDISNDMEPVIVKPNEKIIIDYQDTPKKVYLTYWKDEMLQEENVVLSDYKLTTPDEKGVYVYKISTKWTSTVGGNYLFVNEVE